MAKRQCEVDDVEDGVGLEYCETEKGGTQTVKRRRTSPKEDEKGVEKGEKGKPKDREDAKDRVVEEKGGDASGRDDGAPKLEGEPDLVGEEAATVKRDAVPGSGTVATLDPEDTPKRLTTPKEVKATADWPSVTPPDDVPKTRTRSQNKKLAKVPTTPRDVSGEVAKKEEAPAAPKAPAGRPKKKGTASTVAVASKSTRGTKTAPANAQAVKLAELCKGIVGLPDDVVYVICGKLPPQYLLVLRGTCKRLKTILSKPTAWMESRTGMYGAPAPPEGVSEWRWAAVVWGKECDLCGAKTNDLQEGVDFYVARRHCRKCKWMDKAREIAFPSTEVDKYYPKLSKELLEHVFHTPVEALLPLKNSNHKQFWHVDVRSAVAVWDDFQRGIDARREGAVEKFEKWKEERKRVIASRLDMAKVWAQWKEGMHLSARGMRIQHLKSRLRDLGFKQVDIDAAITAQSVAEIRSPSILYMKGSPEVTTAEWKKFRLVLEPLVEAKQAPRLWQHLSSGALNKRYLDHILTQPPSDFSAYPPLATFAGSAALAYLLPDDPMMKPTSEDLTPFFKELPGLVDRYWAQKKNSLGDMHTARYCRAHELAKHVFVCPDSPSTASGRRKGLTVCIGWQSAARHVCLAEWAEAGLKPPGLAQEYDCHRLRRDNVLSSHAFELVRMVGEDPESATVARMDELDPYFDCESDEGTSLGKVRRVYSWRGAVRHVMEDRNARFSPASEGVAQKARTAAAAFRDRASVWSCNRCHSEGGKLKTDTKSGMIEHLLSEHKISSPKVANDYFFNQDLLHLCEGGYEVSLEHDGVGDAPSSLKGTSS